jgi:hypothetical protein
VAIGGRHIEERITEKDMERIEEAVKHALGLSPRKG